MICTDCHVFLISVFLEAVDNIGASKSLKFIVTHVTNKAKLATDCWSPTVENVKVTSVTRRD